MTSDGLNLTLRRYLDALFIRRLDIVQLFSRRIGLKPATNQEAERKQIESALNDDPARLTDLTAFLEEVADGGRVHFYFWKGCDMGKTSVGQISSRLSELGGSSLINLTAVERIQGEDPSIRFTFEQTRESRQDWYEVPEDHELPDGSRIVYSAVRVFNRPAISTVSVFDNDRVAVYSVAQQERLTDYKPLLGSMQSQLSLVTSIGWSQSSLQQLAFNLAKAPIVQTSNARRKTALGSMTLTSDDIAASILQDPKLRQAASLLATNNAFLKMRCCWSRAQHKPLNQDMILWLNGHEDMINLRQDALPSDTRYVIDELRRLL